MSIVKILQEKSNDHLICHLKRSLKQSGREWNKCFDSFQRNYGLLKSKSDPRNYCCDKSSYTSIYMDDMQIVGETNAFQINFFKCKIMEKFKAKDLGETSEILSMKIQRHPDGSLSFNQTSCIKN